MITYKFKVGDIVKWRFQDEIIYGVIKNIRNTRELNYLLELSKKHYISQYWYVNEDSLILCNDLTMFEKIMLDINIS